MSTKLFVYYVQTIYFTFFKMCNAAFVRLPPSENLELRLELRLSLPLIPEPFIMKCEDIKILSQ